MLDQQAEFLDWLVDVVRSERIELVVVAGDLFDRSVPPAEAWALLWNGFNRIVSGGTRVVAIAGNHDSAERLGATDGLTELAGVYLRGGFHQCAAPAMLHFDDGPLAVLPVPFLDPRVAPPGILAEDGGPSGQRSCEEDDHDPMIFAGNGARFVASHESVLRSALRRGRGLVPPDVASLAVAHAFVTGAAPSDSERELSVGEASMVSASVFDGVDYVALGHLHTPQSVRGADRVRYSGSPLAYSFSETSPKEVVLVEIQGPGRVAAQRLPVEVGRGVRTLRGSLEEMLHQPLDDRHWVRAELTDPERPLDPARRLRDVFPWLAEVEWVGARAAAPASAVCGTPSARRAPHQVAAEFWQSCTGEPPGAEELAVLADLLDPQVSAGEQAA